jgi:CheY-like chemotaxis protein
MAITRMLRGHDVVQASCGAEARDILEGDQAFDLVLCDLMMPNITGVQLHQWLCEHLPDLARRVVFLSGDTCPARIRAYLEAAGNLRIEKPFDVDHLRDVLIERIRMAKSAEGH